jgi:hypothetical protein
MWRDKAFLLDIVRAGQLAQQFAEQLDRELLESDLRTQSAMGASQFCNE